MGLFLGLAAVSGPRLDDDSYGHYARSTRQVLGLDLRAWVTDVWNKPLPGLAYGMGSALGVWGARAVACSFTAAAAYFTRTLVQALLAGASTSPAIVGWSATLLFFAQPALVKDAFVTMTEIPAAMFVAWSLCALWCEQRPRKAALLAGCVPLCRVEMVPVVAVTALYCGYETWRLGPGDGLIRSWWRPLVTASFAGLPFVVWYLAGLAATADVHWFSRASYAYFRTNWELAPLLRYNVLTGLVNVVSPPLLLLLVYGAIGVWAGLFRSRPRVVGHLVLLLGVHYLLLNTLVVYPKDWFGVPPGHGVAAINGRNYSSTAPVLTILLALTSWWEFGCTKESASRDGGVPSSAADLRARLVASAVATLASGALIVLSKSSNVSDLALHLALLALGLGAMCWLWFGRKAVGGGAGRALRLLPIVAIIGALIVRPFFWYPTGEADQRAVAIRALAERIAQDRPTRVIQDTASFLEVAADEWGLDVSRTETGWTWPGDYPRRLGESAPGTWVVLELNSRGEPLSRYPNPIFDQVRSGELQPVAEYRTSPHEGIWSVLDRVSARNAAIGWRAFRSAASDAR